MRRLVLLCFLAVPSASSAKVVEKLAYTYYEANAAETQSVLKALNLASPHRKNGEIFYGLTTWNVHAKYRLHPQPDGSCKLSQVEVELSGTIDLPRLFGANPTQAVAFDRFYAALRTHELGHYDIARGLAAGVETTLLALRKPSCAELRPAVDAVQAETRQTFETRSAAYDAETNHGRTQGASIGE